MPRPKLHGCGFFVREGMLLIDADNAREAARDVVEQLFDDGQIDAEPRASGREGPAQIVENPRRPYRPASRRSSRRLTLLKPATGLAPCVKTKSEPAI